jgi:hypothetical protein
MKEKDEKEGKGKVLSHEDPIEITGFVIGRPRLNLTPTTATREEPRQD